MVTVLFASMLVPGGASADLQSDLANDVREFFDVGRSSVPRADCGPGSMPEPGLQGDVPAADRNNGRSRQGYSCNMSLLGSPGEARGSGLVSASFENCIYSSTLFPGIVFGEPGLRVFDATDPARPVQTAVLAEPAMAWGTWESLKVNPKRKLLAATAVPTGMSAGYFSVYDISDCAHPRLLNPGVGTNLLQPMPFLSHEGGFSPDGNTYWATGVAPGLLTGIDISDPVNPRIISQNVTGLTAHGFGISDDGNRMYMSVAAGITTLDISEVQSRKRDPQVYHLGRLFWMDGQATQHSIPVTYGGKQHVFTIDEAGAGGVKLIDVSDDAEPRFVSKLKLEINLLEHQDSALASGMGGSGFGYNPHYCSADRSVDPTALACGWGQSGIRVFDVRDPANIRELGYLNPPARTWGQLGLPNSPHAWASLEGPPVVDPVAIGRAMVEGQFNPLEAISPRSLWLALGDLSADWCMSPPAFRGNQILVTCSDNGPMVMQFENGVYAAPDNQLSTVGS
ncbi:hypothetical protein O3I_025220 [Nocardia brasiliensis ATCC 700358]|uniref:LVIVD repeat-containing protein n=1 Tax=Nocardia brasiliensis (strain ATCC 700358 / HUJEG-1) TaxID=1133849 RepID=K0F1J3_NOCB7|nr:hypothetical protein O3I_025220 [Nocardia brasiliensis ATCC 700358]